MIVPVLARARELLARYDVLLCDVWGVLHDGRRAYPGANDALTRFRAGGSTVVLVSNAPMPADVVAKVCDEKGVVRSAWDAIVSSGDIALTHIASKHYRRILGIGPRPRDSAFFDRLPGVTTSIEDADCVACTGLVDDRRETAEHYLPILEAAATRNLPFVCANPDLAVHVGHELLPCAGAIAALYEGIGGPVFWAGKPHPAAYAEGMDMAGRIRGAPIPRPRILGIGDAIRTDIAAAHGAGVDALLVTQGLHRDEFMRDGETDGIAASRALAEAGLSAVAIMTGLIW